MAGLNDEIRELLKPFQEGVGLELTYKDGGKRLDLGGLMYVGRSLWWCSEYVLAVAAYADRILNPDDFPEEPDDLMAELIEALAKDDPSGIEAALDRVVFSKVQTRRASPPPFFFPPGDPSFRVGSPKDLRFEFFAGAHENPTRLAFIIAGTVIPVTLTIIIIGMSGLYRQYGEAECLARVQGSTDRRIDLLRQMHRLEGRMTVPLDDALGSIIRAGDAAERRCRTTLDRFSYKITVPPGFTFEMALGPDESAPGP